MPNWCENTIRFTDRDGFERAAKLLRANGGEPRLSRIVSTPRSAYIVSGTELFGAVRLYRDLYATEAERAAIDAYDTWSFRAGAKRGASDIWERMLSDTLDRLREAGADASAASTGTLPERLAAADALAVRAGVARQYGCEDFDFDCRGIVAYGRAATRNIVEYGAATWYDWNNANWGVKWDADVDIFDDEAEMTCSTAWCPPVAAFQKLAAAAASPLVIAYDDEQFTAVTGVVSILPDGSMFEDLGRAELDELDLFRVACVLNDPDQVEHRFDPRRGEIVSVWDCEDEGTDFEAIEVDDLVGRPIDDALDRLRAAI